MSPLARRVSFVAVVATGAALFGAGVGGLASMDSTLQLAAQRTDDRPVLVRYGDGGWDRDWDCPDAPRDPRV